MLGFLIIAVIACTGMAIDKLPPKDNRIRKSGDIIYAWNQDKTRIRKYHAFGMSRCRPVKYRKIALPFQRRWKDGSTSGTVDACTGEVLVNGKWEFYHNLIDDETEESEH